MHARIFIILHDVVAYNLLVSSCNIKTIISHSAIITCLNITRKIYINLQNNFLNNHLIFIKTCVYSQQFSQRKHHSSKMDLKFSWIIFVFTIISTLNRMEAAPVPANGFVRSFSSFFFDVSCY